MLKSSRPFEVWKLGQHINCKKLSQEAGRFLLTVPLLNKFWESTKSLEMDMELVTSTLDSDKLICESEDQAEGSYIFFVIPEVVEILNRSSLSRKLSMAIFLTKKI